MIHAMCGHRLQQYSNRHYQTVQTTDVRKMSQKERKKAVSASLRSEQVDIFVEKKFTLSQFLKNKD